MKDYELGALVNAKNQQEFIVLRRALNCLQNKLRFGARDERFFHNKNRVEPETNNPIFLSVANEVKTLI